MRNDRRQSRRKLIAGHTMTSWDQNIHKEIIRKSELTQPWKNPKKNRQSHRRSWISWGFQALFSMFTLPFHHIFSPESHGFEKDTSLNQVPQAMARIKMPPDIWRALCQNWGNKWMVGGYDARSSWMMTCVCKNKFIYRMNYDELWYFTDLQISERRWFFWKDHILLKPRFLKNYVVYHHTSKMEQH